MTVVTVEQEMATISMSDELTSRDRVLLELRNAIRRVQVRSASILVGVSGGADSVALLRGFKELAEAESLSLTVAHYDHALRAESQADAEWVQALSDAIGLPCVIERRPAVPVSAEEGISEESARRLRYDFFKETAQSRGCQLVAVAHTADDQAETVFHHLIRGTGLAGLGGIPAQRLLSGDLLLIRPLLTVRRGDLVNALAEWKQEYRTDATNQNLRYTRNRIRHDLLPQLREKLNPQVETALLRLSQQADEAQRVIEELAQERLQQAELHVSSLSIRIRRDPFLTAPVIVVREALRQLWIQAEWPRQALSFSHLDQLASQVKTGEPSRFQLPGGIDCFCRGPLLELRRPELPPDSECPDS